MANLLTDKQIAAGQELERRGLLDAQKAAAAHELMRRQGMEQPEVSDSHGPSVKW